MQIRPSLSESASQLIDIYLSGVPREISDLRLSESTRQRLIDYYEEAGLLDVRRAQFFDHHFRRTMHAWLGRVVTRPQAEVLDLGAGLGTQSFVFARLGARVTALDLDQGALQALKERKALIEGDLCAPLDINTVTADAFDFLVNTRMQFDAVYSLFAFNMMQPTPRLVELLSSAVGPNGIVVIHDGNKENLFKRILQPRPHVLAPNELVATFNACGFILKKMEAAIALPPLLWRLLPKEIAEVLDRRARSHRHLALSYLYEFQRVSSK